MLVNPRGSEAKLIERLVELKSASKEWIGVYFSFDKLQVKYLNHYNINIAVNVMDGLLRQCEAEAYVCKDLSVFLLCKKVENQLLEKLIFEIRYLFIDDPVSYNAQGSENNVFCSLYQLNRKLDEFTSLALSKVIGKIGGDASPQPATQDDSIDNDVAMVAKGLVSLNAETMAQIEHYLKIYNIKSTIRRQSVYLFREDLPSRKVFDELYIKINKLGELLNISSNLHENRWLFMYLTEILDANMLDLINQHKDTLLNSSISLNLNIHTVLSERFKVFDSALKQFFKFALIVEIQLSDAIDHLRLFVLARNLLHEMGHRVCLDGLNYLSFLPVDYDKLGFDLVKLHWDADMVTLASRQALADKVKAFGSNRVILTRCDTQDAIDFGQSLGIVLFQGRYLDRLKEPDSIIDN